MKWREGAENNAAGGEMGGDTDCLGVRVVC